MTVTTWTIRADPVVVPADNLDSLTTAVEHLRDELAADPDGGERGIDSVAPGVARVYAESHFTVTANPDGGFNVLGYEAYEWIAQSELLGLLAAHCAPGRALWIRCTADGTITVEQFSGGRYVSEPGVVIGASDIAALRHARNRILNTLPLVAEPRARQGLEAAAYAAATAIDDISALFSEPAARPAR